MYLAQDLVDKTYLLNTVYNNHKIQK